MAEEGCLAKTLAAKTLSAQILTPKASWDRFWRKHGARIGDAADHGLDHVTFDSHLFVQYNGLQHSLEAHGFAVSDWMTKFVKVSWAHHM